MENWIADAWELGVHWSCIKDIYYFQKPTYNLKNRVGEQEIGSGKFKMKEQETYNTYLSVCVCVVFFWGGGVVVVK